MWEQHIEVKDRVREAIYPLLYSRPYKFGSTSGGNQQVPGDAGGYDTQVAGQPGRAVKPYIPPTPEAEWLRILDAPMN